MSTLLALMPTTIDGLLAGYIMLTVLVSFIILGDRS